jgi:diguanylate cyclase (GGDEF)-like protein
MLEGVPDIGDILVAEDGLKGFKLLRENSVDLILCDLIMPDIDGYKFLDLKTGCAELNDIPVILITGRDDVESKVRGLNAGASDYVTKPFIPAELIARVRVHLEIKQLQDALRKKNAQLQLLTQTDPLTNIANRRHLMHSIELEFARLERYKRPMSFFMLDVDHFKKINDEHGHQAGDQVLVNLANILTASVRITDVVSRYGGEEFAILLPETNRSRAFVVAERCRKQIEEMETVFGDKTARVTASFGLVSLPDERVSGVRDIISVADKNLYTSKREGRNRITK